MTLHSSFIVKQPSPTQLLDTLESSYLVSAFLVLIEGTLPWAFEMTSCSIDSQPVAQQYPKLPLPPLAQLQALNALVEQILLRLLQLPPNPPPSEPVDSESGCVSSALGMAAVYSKGQRDIMQRSLQVG